MGRPTVPKSEAKTILRGALFARDEVKTVDRAITNSGQNKSEWIRNALINAAQRA